MHPLQRLQLMAKTLLLVLAHMVQFSTAMTISKADMCYFDNASEGECYKHLQEVQSWIRQFYIGLPGSKCSPVVFDGSYLVHRLSVYHKPGIHNLGWQCRRHVSDMAKCRLFSSRQGKFGDMVSCVSAHFCVTIFRHWRTTNRWYLVLR